MIVRDGLDTLRGGDRFSKMVLLFIIGTITRFSSYEILYALNNKEYDDWWNQLIQPFSYLPQCGAQWKSYLVQR